MTIHPARLEFESEEDIIDYLTFGIAPKRAYAVEVLDELRTPGVTRCHITFIPEDKEHTANILSQVYDNFVFMQRIYTAVALLSGFTGFTIGRHFGLK